MIASYLLLKWGNTNTTKSSTDKKRNLVDCWTERKDTCMMLAVSVGTGIANLVATETPSATSTTTNTTTVDNNMRAKWIISLASSSLLRHRKPYLAEALISLWCPSAHPKRSTLPMWKSLALNSFPKETTELRNETNCFLRSNCPLTQHQQRGD